MNNYQAIEELSVENTAAVIINNYAAINSDVMPVNIPSVFYQKIKLLRSNAVGTFGSEYMIVFGASDLGASITGIFNITISADIDDGATSSVFGDFGYIIGSNTAARVVWTDTRGIAEGTTLMIKYEISGTTLTLSVQNYDTEALIFTKTINDIPNLNTVKTYGVRANDNEGVIAPGLLSDGTESYWSVRATRTGVDCEIYFYGIFQQVYWVKARISSTWKFCVSKIWDGSNWVSKPIKRWTGTEWKYGAYNRVWSAGYENLVGRNNHGCCGSQNSGLIFGGYLKPGSDPRATITTEESNGVSWSYGGNMTTERYNMGSCGTQNAALSACGSYKSGVNYYYGAITREYNGVSWNSGGNAPASRNETEALGVQTSALMVGGTDTGDVGTSLEYNGSSWSSSASLSTAKYNGSSCGTQTAGLYCGGRIKASSAGFVTTEEYNGTSWTLGGDMTQKTHGNSVFGSQTDAVSVITSTGTDTRVQEYNGSTWSNKANFPYAARYGMRADGIASHGFLTGGGTGVLGSENNKITYLYDIQPY